MSMRVKDLIEELQKVEDKEIIVGLQGCDCERNCVNIQEYEHKYYENGRHEKRIKYALLCSDGSIGSDDDLLSEDYRKKYETAIS